MKYYLISMLFILAFSSCNQKIEIPKEQSIETTQKHTLIKFNDTLVPVNKQEDTCTCKENNKGFRFIPERYFGPLSDDYDTLSNEEILNTKTITFVAFDTIPLKFAEFKNVETIILRRIDWQEIIGLDLFPKLKNM